MLHHHQFTKASIAIRRPIEIGRHAPFHLFVCYHLACASLSAKALCLVMWTTLPALKCPFFNASTQACVSRKPWWATSARQTRPLHWLPRPLRQFTFIGTGPGEGQFIYILGALKRSWGAGRSARVSSSLLVHPVPTNTHPTCQQLSHLFLTYLSSPVPHQDWIPAPKIPFFLKSLLFC